MNKKLVQINVVCNGSTGRIMNQIQKEVESQGWEAYSFYGRGNPVKDNCIKIGNRIDVIFHVLITRLLDKHGHASKRATKKLIKQIKEINPDVIQLHNIHGYYIHLKTLFNYLKKSNKKIVWTLHDCWAFTGHCSHFIYPKCDKWQNECSNCIRKKDYPKSFLCDRSKKEYLFKKELFTNIKDLTIVVPSKWLAELVKKSFLKEYKIKVINNGIDLNIYKPTNTINVRKKYNIPTDKKIILGVSSIWNENKGLNEFYKLSQKIDENYVIVLVGLKKNQIKKLPNNIIGIERTENEEELANFYTEAEVLYNPSKEETFSLVSVEAIACGTPVIGYNTGIIPELIGETNGICMDIGKEESIIENISKIKKDVLNKESCKYSIDAMKEKYMKLYNKF